MVKKCHFHSHVDKGEWKGRKQTCVMLMDVVSLWVSGAQVRIGGLEMQHQQRWIYLDEWTRLVEEGVGWGAVGVKASGWDMANTASELWPPK